MISVLGLYQHPVRALSACAVLLGLATGTGCASSCSSKKPPPLPPLSERSWRIDLPLENHAPASVALPLGATTPRPIAVVLHGAQDRPEWQCGSFRGVLGGQMFIVCPAGKVGPAPADRYTLGNATETAAELRALLKALKERFGEHVAKGSVLLIGYGEGAELALELARQEPSFFARVALVAGKPSALSSSTASIFGRGGGKRLLILCTTAACAGDAALRALWLQRAGVAARSVRRDVGPFLDAAFTAALRSEVPWLLEGDSRFPRP